MPFFLFFPFLFSSLDAILSLSLSLSLSLPLSLSLSPCEGAVSAPSINATIKVSTLLVLDLTSHPTLPNVSAPHLTAPAVINKEPGSPHLTHPWDTDCLVNNISDVTLLSREGRNDEARR